MVLHVELPAKRGPKHTNLAVSGVYLKLVSLEELVISMKIIKGKECCSVQLSSEGKLTRESEQSSQMQSGPITRIGKSQQYLYSQHLTGSGLRLYN